MNSPSAQQRLYSLDFMRGFIMVLLMLEGARFYESLADISKATILEPFARQFFHHPWNGLRFWDLIQPGFMFIAGTSMALSLNQQAQLGVTWQRSFLKVLKRSALLFFFGVLDYAVRPNGLSFELWDVLTQLSFTTLVTFLIFRWSITNQILFSLGLLLLTELLYRFTNVAGFDQPFTDQHNFGNYMDLVLMNKINEGGWVAINCLPTSAHTIWGAIAGKIILSNHTAGRKVRTLVVAGGIALVVGYTMDISITPIIKKIATSSFTIASGGWCLLMLAGCYWWIDVKHHQQRLAFFMIVGMNSLFIYLFFEIVGSRWFNDYVSVIVIGLLDILKTPPTVESLASAIITFALEWCLCLFLYKKGIFFRA